ERRTYCSMRSISSSKAHALASMRRSERRFGAANMLANVYPEFTLTAPKPANVIDRIAPIQIPFRRQETIYVLPQADRIVIVFSVAFQDKTDQAIARIFLQEFAEARRHVNNAPPVSFGKDPPLELRGVPNLRQSTDHVGYLSFGTASL
uniref:Arp2/3 complex 34 kDa subunit n=1 Tax=Hucho hucho TaxID=62062 RepID=A0A4W5LFJ4_9TELE